MAKFSSLRISEKDFHLAEKHTYADRLLPKPLTITLELVPKTQGVMILELVLPGETSEEVVALPLLPPMAKYLADQLNAGVDQYLNSCDPEDTE